MQIVLTKNTNIALDWFVCKKGENGCCLKRKIEECLLKYLCIVLRVKLVKNPHMKSPFQSLFYKGWANKLRFTGKIFHTFLY